MNYALVKTPIAPLYLQPKDRSELADEALCGWRVEILEELPGGWRKVRTHYRYSGFVPGDCLVPDCDVPDRWESLPKLAVTRFTADVLNAPKVQGGCLITLPRGCWVSPVGPADQNGWLPVALCDGRRGYTKESFLGEELHHCDLADEEALREALEPYGTRLSLLLPEALLQSGGDAESGQDLAVLLPLVDAVST